MGWTTLSSVFYADISAREDVPAGGKYWDIFTACVAEGILSCPLPEQLWEVMLRQGSGSVWQSKKPDYCDRQGNLFLAYWCLKDAVLLVSADPCSFHPLPFHRGSFSSLPRPSQWEGNAVGSYVLTWQWLFQLVSMPREDDVSRWPCQHLMRVPYGVGQCCGGWSRCAFIFRSLLLGLWHIWNLFL